MIVRLDIWGVQVFDKWYNVTGWVIWWWDNINWLKNLQVLYE